MRLAIFGIPGSGKSTQGNLLSKQLRIPYLSTGHIFRNLAKEKTALGRKVKEIIASGTLVSDKVTIEIVEQYLKRQSYKNGFIIDGFPRTLSQAKSMSFDFVIYLAMDDKEALWRLAGREEDRDDDQLSIIKNRLALFHQEHEKIINYYREKNILLEIDAVNDIQAINTAILALLGKEMVDNHLQNRPKKSHLLLITGLPGSGKSEAVRYFQSKDLGIYSISSVVNDAIAQANLPYNLASQEKIRSKLRQEHGMDALIKLSIPKIESLLKKHDFVVLDGYRSFEELLYLSSKLDNVQIHSLALLSPAALRDERIANRSDKKVFGRERDKSEIFFLNMGPSIALADFFIINDSTLEAFHAKLEEVYREIVYSL